MATTLPRISAVVERPIYDAVSRLAKKDGVSLSQKARDLLVEALEVVEDAGLVDLVRERRRNRAPAISLDAVKRRLGIR